MGRQSVSGLMASVIAVGSCAAPEQAAYLADTDSWVMESSVSGREYQISVAVPRGYYDSSDEYPVLYAVDANGMFGTVVESARGLYLDNMFRPLNDVPELVVVGIGYPVGHYENTIGPRSFDFGPTVDREWEERVTPLLPGGIGPLQSGGAPDFLRFLREELIPHIDREYRLSDDRAFLGHSAGGLFALYALFEGDGAFRRFIAASPALWWDDGYVFDLEAEFGRSHSDLPATVFLTVGMREDEELWISNVRRLVSVFEDRGYEGLRWQAEYLEGEDHMSVVPTSVSRGLRYVYSDPSR